MPQFRRLRDDHNQMVASLAALSVPIPMSVYDAAGQRGAWADDVSIYLTTVLRMIKPVYGTIAKEAHDHAGVTVEPWSTIQDAMTDITSSIQAMKKENQNG